MPKNIVIFSDGTGQAGGLRPDQRLSNVYKLYRAARPWPDSPISPAQQVAYYDPGLGSAEIGGLFWEQPIALVRKLLSSATGMGFSRNVIDCYEQILRFYEPGDRIFLFGFSRGAYTVRAVGGVMNLCGVPTCDVDGSPLPNYGQRLREIATEAVCSVYEHGAGHPREKYEAEREEKARRFRQSYCSQDDPSENRRGNVVPYFIGVFDTVAALGTSGIKSFAILAIAALAIVAGVAAASWVLQWLFGADRWIAAEIVALIIALAVGVAYFRAHYREIRDWPSPGRRRWHFATWRFKHYDMFLDPRVHYGRHAQAIDETRKDFARVGWGQSRDVDSNPADWLVQKWFAGDHSDIGGSYPEPESRLSDIALQWMVEEATNVPHPLLLDPSKLRTYPDASAMQHCEVASVLARYPRWVPRRLRLGWTTAIRSGASLEGCHESVLQRIRLPSVRMLGIAQPYRPVALQDDPLYRELIATATRK
jgi:uncharacterized protein (DUF2235 family)